QPPDRSIGQTTTCSPRITAVLRAMAMSAMSRCSARVTRLRWIASANAGTPASTRLAASASTTMASVSESPRIRSCIILLRPWAGPQCRRPSAAGGSAGAAVRGRKTPSQAPSRWIVTLDGPRPRPPMTSPHPATFQLVAPYQPAGDQPRAIEKLVEGFEDGLARQTLLGVTGSGKTYTIANVIERVQKPTLVMAPNKTLAAQLYGEFKQFFPHNAVEYF